MNRMIVLPVTQELVLGEAGLGIGMRFHIATLVVKLSMDVAEQW